MAAISVEPSQDETRAAVLRGLTAHNLSRVGSRNTKPLTISLRDESGAIVGGLVGELKWEWLYVDLLWIDEAHRGSGFGEALVAKAEQEARDHGAKGVFLGTMSIQAPEFYPRLGYRECGRMENYPVAGQTLHHFTKAL
jgi:ribosomal protein S18 acetylase RimI-like enzyme